MNYQKIYDALILKAKSLNRKRDKNGVYYERHHITPKCLGGENNEDNLVLLTAKEHFVAHKLLAEIYPDNRKIFYAYHCMFRISKKHSNNRNYIVSVR